MYLCIMKMYLLIYLNYLICVFPLEYYNITFCIIYTHTHTFTNLHYILRCIFNLNKLLLLLLKYFSSFIVKIIFIAIFLKFYNISHVSGKYMYVLNANHVNVLYRSIHKMCVYKHTGAAEHRHTQFWRSALLNTACWEHVNTHKH